MNLPRSPLSLMYVTRTAVRCTQASVQEHENLSSFSGMVSILPMMAVVSIPPVQAALLCVVDGCVHGYPYLHDALANKTCTSRNASVDELKLI